jgi:large subunit ribosomal protein L31
MAKSSSVHPKYRIITVKKTSGEEVKMRSTYKDDFMSLDIDPSTHPAWNAETKNVTKNVDNTIKNWMGGINMLDL